MKRNNVVALIFTGLCAAATASPAAHAGTGPTVVEDTRVFSCGNPNGNVRKCAEGEERHPVSGALVLHLGGGVCEKTTYTIGIGEIYRSADGTQQAQMPSVIERIYSFPCDGSGKPT